MTVALAGIEISPELVLVDPDLRRLALEDEGLANGALGVRPESGRRDGKTDVASVTPRAPAASPTLRRSNAFGLLDATVGAGETSARRSGEAVAAAGR
jgi:hypothetical protein